MLSGSVCGDVGKSGVVGLLSPPPTPPTYSLQTTSFSVNIYNTLTRMGSTGSQADSVSYSDEQDLHCISL